MIRPVNTSLDEFIKRKFGKDIITSSKAVSVITCTNQTNSLDNILKNFAMQDYPKKELIIVVNNNEDIDLKDWRDKIDGFKNIFLYKLSGDVSLGKCLNFGVHKSRYGIIAKFDDDDYYGPKYLSEVVACFDTTGAKLIGKGSTFVYIVNTGILTIRNPKEENRYTNFINGSTLVFKKEIFEKVQFKDITVGEDIEFCNDCVKLKIPIYSCSKFNHVYIRYPSKNVHTWIIEDDDLIKLCCRLDLYNKRVKDIDSLSKYVDI